MSGGMSGGSAFRLHGEHGLENPTLIVAWEEDAAGLGVRIADYLVESLGCRPFGEILPEGFFPMAGVSVVDDVAQFPESRFYVSDERNLVVFKSNIPRTGWHGFLNALLDVAQHDCHVSGIYTMGAMISPAPHTGPRLLISVVNDRDMKEGLEPFNIMTTTDYESPPGQKPTLSSYLIWLAKQRGIPGANLWVPVPFYLASADDPLACKRLVYFFNSKLDLGIDFTGLDARIARQNGLIADLLNRSPGLEGMVRKLETGEGLDGEESEKLAREIGEALAGK